MALKTRSTEPLGIEHPIAQGGMMREWDFADMKALLSSADPVEGPKAFAEKRAPVWTGTLRRS